MPSKLIEILNDRCLSDTDRFSASRISLFLGSYKTKVGKEVVEKVVGLTPGSVLAPALFNIYIQ
jgi:hypothetical protein